MFKYPVLASARNEVIDFSSVVCVFQFSSRDSISCVGKLVGLLVYASRIVVIELHPVCHRCCIPKVGAITHPQTTLPPNRPQESCRFTS